MSTVVYDDLTCWLLGVFTVVTGDALTLANCLNSLHIKTPTGKSYGYVSVVKALQAIRPRPDAFNALNPIQQEYYMALAQANRASTQKGNK
ncbi:hypothetical protein GN109_15145 [Collimonas pratensis]|uniref:hypothetical protein n=1 Tax=Collimonas pratensis TaxID=279113 RepID=UPI00143D408F|nr:hypothetical protein [Collimonas pratensis]NKI70758.1 hypothetical protein [Collimonas pratensis]